MSCELMFYNYQIIPSVSVVASREFQWKKTKQLNSCKILLVNLNILCFQLGSFSKQRLNKILKHSKPQCNVTTHQFSANLIQLKYSYRIKFSI